MLKFFRSIRQKLVNEGRIKNYLTYAMGEVILLVVGILIALQINNWNNDRSNHQKELEYLKNIQRDLRDQLKDIENQHEYEQTQMNTADEFIKSYEIGASSKFSDTALAKLTTLVTRSDFLPVDPTFQDLKSTGNLILINNYSLRNELIRYYQKLNDFASTININNNSFVDQLFVHDMIDNSLVNMTNLSEMSRRFNSNVPGISESLKENLNKNVRKNLNEPGNQILVINLLSTRYLVSSLHRQWMADLKSESQRVFKLVEKEMKDG
jgi:hypothetical protein